METLKDKADKKKQSRRGPASVKSSDALLAAKKKMRQQTMQGKSVDAVIKDDYATAQSSKSMVKGKTGIVFDHLMEKHLCLWDNNYPECPSRFTYVMKRIEELGLLEQCVVLPSRDGTVDEILKKHTLQSIEILKETDKIDDVERLEALSSKYDAIFINSISYKTALLSVGCAIDLVDAIIKGDLQNGMAVIRPPGHHAMADEYCGYCFFNNVALAATHALESGVQRILIVDWDVHHGQGTQQMFYDDPRVLYFSIHRYENGTFWPNLRQSDYDYIGEGKGVGYNFNVPLNNIGMTDADYLAIFQKLLLPVAYEFLPNFVIVSAGYDAALGDEKGEMEISPACYAHLTSALMSLAGGKVAVVLEGGYCLKSLADGAALTLRALLGAPAPLLFDFGAPCDSIVDTILNVIHVQRPYWQSLTVEELGNAGDEELHIPHIEFLGDETKPDHYATRNCYPIQSPDFLRDVDARLNRLRILTKLVNGPRVGFVTDPRMERHCDKTDHPEKPERIKAIVSKHEEFSLLSRCVTIESRLATEDELLLTHSKDHISKIQATANMPDGELHDKANDYDSVYFNSSSYECARLAAGSVLQMVDSVLSGEVTCGVAAIRPPGHHAEEDAASGFCLFNNVALAAKHAVENHGLQKVLLLDWDVHHGNGIQRMFEEDPRVLYISLHRYNHAHFFPSSTDANYDKIGVGPGTGFNINIPWNKSGGGLTDGDYISAFHSIVLPVAYQYQPQLVLISAGFDACINDPLGHCKLSPELYGHMTRWLAPLAGGRLVLALEGGYNVTSVSYAMALCTKALLGDPIPSLIDSTTPSPSALETIRNVLITHQPFWTSLAFNKKLPHTRKDRSRAKKEVISEKVVLDKNELPKDYSSIASEGASSSSGYSKQQVNEGTSQTLNEFLLENAAALENEEMFALVPRTHCPHLEAVAPISADGISHVSPCSQCKSSRENWVCLSCYQVACGRHVNGHMKDHCAELDHPLTLSFTDLSVWCYACDAYIDNPVFYQAKNCLHRAKFGCDMPWSYGETPALTLS